MNLEAKGTLKANIRKNRKKVLVQLRSWLKLLINQLKKGRKVTKKE